MNARKNPSKTFSSFTQWLKTAFAKKSVRYASMAVAGIIVIVVGVFVALGAGGEDSPVSSPSANPTASGALLASIEDEVLVTDIPEEELEEAEELFGDIWGNDGEQTGTKTKDGKTEGSADPSESAYIPPKVVNKDTYQIYVSKNSFTIAILGLDSDGEYTKVVRKFSTGIGRSSAQTRAGAFEITGKERWHKWSGSSYSPYAVKYSGGVYIHGPIYSTTDSNAMKPNSYNEIGTSCSSGCLRTTCSAAAWVYYNCPVGTKVIVANDSKYTSGRPASVPSDQTYDPTDPGASPEIPITSMSLNASTASIKTGETYQVKVSSFAPANTSTKTFVYTSSNSSVASVSASGVVTGLTQGTAVITVTADDPYGKSASCTVTVTPGAVVVTSVTLNASSKTINVGEAYQLTATVKPDDATNKGCTFTSSNAGIATVDGSGRVVGVSAGTVTITARANDVSGTTATCTITVENKVTSISAGNINIDVGQTGQLTVTVNPSSANKNLTYTSNAPGIATVNGSGVVTGASVGTATIMVTDTVSGKSTTCTVTVKALPVESPSPSPEPSESPEPSVEQEG